MNTIKRKIDFQIKCILILAIIICGDIAANAQTLQDIGSSIQSSPQVTIYTAKEIITINPVKPGAEAVAVVNGRILAIGTLEELIRMIGNQPSRIDKTFNDKIIVPGFIAQHDHPVLAALTMASEVLSIEDWELPTGTVPAVKDKKDFMERLAAAEKKNERSRRAIGYMGIPSKFLRATY